jgi:hypothetical protein
LAQLAPDGRIYMSSNSGTRYLHVIEQPDSLGLACSVCQHCVELPSYNSFSIPNFPNYRLHHEVGSPCDTLRSPPLANWAYQDSALQVRFQDQSRHDIRRWQWSFGDGGTDTVAAPVHTYAQPGVYEVCLSVENPRGQDVSCENVAVFATSTTELSEKAPLRVLPNPVRRGEPLRVHLAAGLPAGVVELVSASGQQLGQWPVAAGQRELSLPTGELSAGVYSLGLRLAEEVRWVKVVVQ